MKKIIAFVVMASVALLAGCTKTAPSDTSATCGVTPDASCETPTQPQPETGAFLDMTDKNSVLNHALTACKNFDLQSLALVASREGIRFSPYSYVDTGSHIILDAAKLQNSFDEKASFVRGTEDGTGDPILLTLKDYFKRFVYDVDFIRLGQIYTNEFLQRGNTVNNIGDVYSGAVVVEYFVPGINPEYEGLDWSSLHFVLAEEDGLRKVKAIVHNQWTI